MKGVIDLRANTDQKVRAYIVIEITKKYKHCYVNVYGKCLLKHLLTPLENVYCVLQEEPTVYQIQIHKFGQKVAFIIRLSNQNTTKHASRSGILVTNFVLHIVCILYICATNHENRTSQKIKTNITF